MGLTKVITPVFQGYFSNWSSACKSANDLRGNNLIEPFDSTRWMARQREMLELARSGKYARPTNLPLLSSSLMAEYIVDLGGGSGWTSELLTKLKSVKTNYIVLEIPSVCEEFSKDFTSNSRVTFFSVMSDAPKQMISSTDVLYSNSVIQYFEDDSNLMELVSFLSPKYILLDDFQSSTGDTFYSLQNYYGVFMPYRFMNFQDIKIACERLGYELIFKSEYPNPIAAGMAATVQGAGYSVSEIGPALSLLFKKII